MAEKRHYCVICKKKRYEKNMLNVFHVSWACHTELIADDECHLHPDIKIMQEILELNSRFTLLDVGYLKTATNTQKIDFQ